VLSTYASLFIGLAFLLLGAINVWLALEAGAHKKSVRANSRMLSLHRIGGYLFIALFCGMAYSMTSRLQSTGDNSPAVTLHLALALILAPLLCIKILVARYYRNQYGLLLPLGLTIFVLAFVLIAGMAGPRFVRTTRIEQVRIDRDVATVSIDLAQAAGIMQQRCSRCHNLDRIFAARKDARGWAETVNRMRALPDSGLSVSEADIIVSYLASQRPESSQEVGRALVEQRCGRCHNLDRVYKTVQSPDDWRATVARMADYAAGSSGEFQPGEDERIIVYLTATQTPGAAHQKNLSIARNTPSSTPPAESPHRDRNAILFLSFVCLAAVGLIVRRPGGRIPAPPTTPAAPPQPGPSGPLLLQLIRITPQTSDAKTLRFALKGRPLDARPGQFLTLTVLFDGKRETRCYSICSSPARTGYVEITPKRVGNGCVSVFLNDRASIGLTLEATGPFGQFCLDAAVHRNIVLFAAGSGITPMMAMLRYIDDLCLDIRATLVYCVRTAADIIFRDDLDELQSRLPNFRYHLILSQPDNGWTGPSGRITREFVGQAVPDLVDRHFFLCGPPPFMDLARTILLDAGASPEHIRQEIFGAAPAPSVPSGSAGGTFVVEFTRLGKRISVPADRTLLQSALENGVAIPSACRQGQCGTCKTRMLEGRVHMSAEDALDAEARGKGYILACVARPESDTRLDA
jgi:ferredoxin-NADP reductase/mono/diheme cytochrome c family protein